MKKINYKSDFDFILDLKDCRGNSLGFQDYDWELLLYTITKADGVKVSYIRKKCMNCFNDNGRIHVVLNSPRFAPGVLKAEIRIHFPDDRYPDGVKTEVTHTELDIQLVTGKSDDYTLTTTTVTVPNVQSSEDVDALKQEISNQKKLINNLRREVGYIYANGYMPVNCTNYNYIYATCPVGMTSDAFWLKMYRKSGATKQKFSLPNGVECREVRLCKSDGWRGSYIGASFSKVSDSLNNEYLVEYDPRDMHGKDPTQFCYLIQCSSPKQTSGRVYMRIDENRELHFLRRLPEGTSRKKLAFNYEMLVRTCNQLDNNINLNSIQLQRRKRKKIKNYIGEWVVNSSCKTWVTVQRKKRIGLSFKLRSGVYRARKINNCRKSDWVYFKYMTKHGIYPVNWI